ncbi:MAG: RNA polymerase sigma factor [Aureliella sp.]
MNPPESNNDPEQLVEHFFRHESAGLVATLTRLFGFALIDVVEDMVQEALLQALRSWRLSGVPRNPAGWLHRVARNRVIDELRRRKTQAEWDDDLALQLGQQEVVNLDATIIEDSQLRMIFACCHPSLDRTSQLALTLKILCGLGDHEIGRGLLMTKEAARKRVQRAKRSLQLAKITVDFPEDTMLAERLDAVHEVLYLMFNEGYAATRGEQHLRIDLCEEAARLCDMLCRSKFHTPSTRALLALQLFHAARFTSRIDAAGEAVLLDDQDRNQWDRSMISVAEFWLARSADGNEISSYHLEAGIARIHARSESSEQTNWEAILQHYELLNQLYPSPIREVNRAITLGRLHREDEAIELLDSISSAPELRFYPPFHFAQADLLERVGEKELAITQWNKALELIDTPQERALIEHRIEKLLG